MADQTDWLYILGKEASDSVRDEFEQGKQIEKLEGYYDEARTLGVPARAKTR